VAEAQSEPSREGLGDMARAAGFQIERTMLEAEGICPSCAEKVETCA
jgi:Fur family zinc uptake transcriptional regulator